MSSSDIPINLGAFRRRWIVILVIVAILSAIPLFALAYVYFTNEELQRAQNRVSLYRSTLINALERFQHLPFVLARDTHVLKAARGEDRAALSVRLSRFAAQTDLEAIYLMDRSGLTVSASNYDAPITFLNQNYGFRPYFRKALAGQRGEFFGIGATTSLPGFFIAEPVRDEIGTPVGVIAIKLGLSNLEKSWKDGGEFVFASNADGVVVLSSEASWRYHTLTDISSGRRAAIQANRQFGVEPLSTLNWTVKGASSIVLDGTHYLHVTTSVPKLGWTLHFLAEEGPIWQRSMVVVIVVAIIASVLLTIALFFRSERIRIALQASQADSRQLRAINAKLATEIEERRMAEQRLERARSELARASKLAALGQLSASVTHELGQPIAAMRNYLAAAEFDDDPNGRQDRLNRLNGLVTRIESIFNQLKFFAKPGFSGAADARLEEVDLRAIWTGARELLETDIENAGVELTLSQPEQPVLVRGNHLRLEQVLINLVRNAIAAMETAKKRALQINIDTQNNRAILSVADSGQGLGNYSLEQLQEPFLTTRASGEGMGLGLAISTEIIKEHDGRLTAETRPDGGAVFAIDLPLAAEKEAA
ncbi:MAG: ATP-binding protein [Alphaproteobacteria bacterium]|nr:ATP-binding protein [Alphaproteobacteria bacterium]